MKQLRIYLVEDEESLRISLADDLLDAGYDVRQFADAQSALEALSSRPPDVIITDIRMPGMSGLDLLRELRRKDTDTIVIVMTAHGSIESAVEAMKAGAHDYLTKPFESDELLLLMQRIQELLALRATSRYWDERCRHRFGLNTLVGKSSSTHMLLQQIQTVADTPSTVLIVGETGTGKELVANIVHYNSPRRNGPMITLSAAILSREMFESELFGHEKGAFTGAVKDKQGRFELADGGTLYLDDVDDIPLDLQVKLLRVLEQRELERVGGSETIKVDVRLIASTKIDLRKKVDEGLFREDLYYRLNIFPIQLAPLRERTEDIRPLMEYWLGEFSHGRSFEVREDVYSILEKYYWRGNVRELKNLMERLSLTARDGVIDASLLPLEILSAPEADVDMSDGLEKLLADTEIRAIISVLDQCQGNKAQAARLLGIPASTLRTKMEKYGI
jgi:DNA-binding NtrC family response regulator